MKFSGCYRGRYIFYLKFKLTFVVLVLYITPSARIKTVVLLIKRILQNITSYNQTRNQLQGAQFNNS
jgi:hypothetical protein